jgi:methyltransferase (TIGR00027 family)
MEAISRTSQAVALLRAEMERPATPAGDPAAQRRLCAGMRPIRGWVRPRIIARTQFFDQQVLAAIEAGVPQVVICGAGYDDRALRFRSPGTEFFELDHPATQADKARRLAEFGASDDVALAPADFRVDDVAAVLAAAGHDTARPTLFLCEGLIIYLEAAVIGRLLGGLRSRAAGGSALAASLATHPEGMDSAQVAAALNAGRGNGEAEPWVTIRPVAEQVRTLERAGWSPEQCVDPATLEPTAPSGRSLLVLARADGARDTRESTFGG